MFDERPNAMTSRTLYTNSPHRKVTLLNFFKRDARRATSAQLACPFFTTMRLWRFCATEAAGCGMRRGRSGRHTPAVVSLIYYGYLDTRACLLSCSA